MNTRQAVDRLAAFYNDLSPASLAQLATLYAPDARFKDPFNEVVGVEAIGAIFHHMYDTLEVPAFEVTNRLVDGDQAMLGWVFRFRRGTRTIAVRGVTHFVFDGDGKVVLHRDYWDAAEELYGKLPVIGPVMRWLAARLSASV